MSIEHAHDSNPSQDQLSVIGGGISGLLAAKAALDRGEKNIVVYEAKKRLGGKIEDAKLGPDKTIVRMGPEFVDEDHVLIKELSEELVRLGYEDAKLIPCGEQSHEFFQSPSGKVIPDFIEKYRPIAKRMIEIRNEMKHHPEMRERLQNMSAKEFLEEVAASVVVNPNPTISQRLYNLVTLTSNRVPKEITDTALNVMDQELSVNSDKITAMQFLAETSANEDRFLASTCDYRVQGGTYALVEGLRKHLESRGVRFETGHKLTSLQKDGNEKLLTFDCDGKEHTVRSGRAIIAMAAYDLHKVKGLEFLGIERDTVQYTKNVKATVMLKPGAPNPTEVTNAFLKDTQCWSPDPGFVTFLPHNKYDEPPAILLPKLMQNYADAFGMKVDDLFYIEGGKPLAGTFLYNDPKDAPCFSSPSPETALVMQKRFERMEAMANQGLGFVGTYIPKQDGGVGFMECGAASVQRVCDRMYGMAREHQIGHSQEIAQSIPFAHRLQQEQNHGLAL